MKNKKLVHVTIFLLLAFSYFLTNCKDNDDMDDTPNYSNCCGTAPLEATVDIGNIYIPNMFTPNGDGINDILQIHADNGISKIDDWKIMKANGELVFERKDFDTSIEHGWDGIDMDGNIITGLFNFEVTVTSVNGQSSTFSGYVCAYTCDDTDFPSEVLNGCGFPAQHNGNGNWDTALPSLESDCFN